jgi:hypothetical protein
VTLNGKALGVLWKPPYRVDVGDVLRQGRNVLEVTLVNTWANRLIGDAALPAERRKTYVTSEMFMKDQPLFRAGLRGPVTIHAGQVVGQDH